MSKKILTLTLVGQSASGKTNMLASLLFNNNALIDLSEGNDKVAAPSLTLERTDETISNVEELQRHYRRMLSGRDELEGEGSLDVRSYSCRLEFDTLNKAQPKKRGFFRRASTSTLESFGVELFDGRGGDIAPEVPEEELDEPTKARRDAYRDAMEKSSAVLVCMPVQKEAYNDDVVRRFLPELKRALDEKEVDPQLPRLNRVAICFTKYEAEFLDKGVNAIELAADRDTFKKLMSGHASLEMFRDFVSSNRGRASFDLRFFPVSSYGFIGEGGAPNFYGYPEARGIKTRSIDSYRDYDDPELPGYKSHFPVAMNDAEAVELWFPFNVAPPFLFAATGKVTGPISLDARELGFAPMSMGPAP